MSQLFHLGFQLSYFVFQHLVSKLRLLGVLITLEIVRLSNLVLRIVNLSSLQCHGFVLLAYDTLEIDISTLSHEKLCSIINKLLKIFI